MKNAFGVILTGDMEAKMRELTRTRSVAALPVGGRYRIIDIILSNMTNIGVENVGVITQRNYHSLMDHLGSGKEWDLSRKRDGLFILPPYVSSANRGTYDGTLDALNSNINYLRRSSQKYVILTHSNLVYNVDFDDVIDQHVKTGADITLLYHRALGNERDEECKLSYVAMDQDGRVRDIEIRPFTPHYRDTLMEVYVMEKALLLYIVDMALAHGKKYLLDDVLQHQLHEYKVYGYKYEGYCAHVETINNYYHLNMDMLNSDIRHQIFGGDRPVYTKTKDEVPAKYGAESCVTNSLIADGCVVEGTVENCVLFRGVRIGKGAVVRNCILMQASDIGENCEADHVIMDKNAHLRANSRLIGTERFPIVVEKNMIV